MNRAAPDGARTQFVLAWKIRGFRSAELLTLNCYVGLNTTLADRSRQLF